MRKRLLLVLAVIGAISIAGFAIPLIEVSSQARTREFVQQRQSDTTRLAGLANEYVTTGDPARIADELRAYHEVYGDSVLVVSTRGVADTSVGDVDPAMRAAVTRGLRNEKSSSLSRISPWGPDEAIFVAPIGTGAQVNGALVLRSSTAVARTDVGRWWLIIAAGAVAVVAAFAALALALSRWVLRPLSDLSDAMTGLTAELPSIPASAEQITSAEPSTPTGPPEIRELSTTFDSLMSTVLRSVEMQRRLVADTSHQLRNPLAALQFRLDILEPEIPASAAEDFRMVTAETERLQAILDKLLTLASAETPSLATTPAQWCTLHTVLTERVEFWSVPAAERGATLTLESDDDDPGLQVALSDTALSEVIDVLVDNATRHAGDRPHIVISVRTRDASPATIEISVADDGPGVTEEDLPKLTERFFTRDRAHGTGLGLAIVDVLVRSAGGALSFGTSPSGGLDVGVRLPARSADATPRLEKGDRS
ncbi:HAMP domain-containing sensor histidine kinase [Gordonia sp. VNQ95]|uniref:sensor histidine kinase n=1 Tax=Gordonia sp. VNQ95 TaxID=3156619 RepID=UPI0032B34383